MSYSTRAADFLRLLSFFVYALSFLAFLATIAVYNPNNLFGGGIIPTIDPPENTVIQSFWEEGCSPLSNFDESNFNREFTLAGVQLNATYARVDTDYEWVDVDSQIVQSEIISNGTSGLILVDLMSSENYTTIASFDFQVLLTTAWTSQLSGDPAQCEELYYSLFLGLVGTGCVSGETPPACSFTDTTGAQFNLFFRKVHSTFARLFL